MRKLILVDLIIIALIITSAWAILVSIGLLDLRKEQKTQKAMNEVMTAEIRSFDERLKAYCDKVDDLSIAYINHHGNFPRRVRDDN